MGGTETSLGLGRRTSSRSINLLKIHGRVRIRGSTKPNLICTVPVACVDAHADTRFAENGYRIPRSTCLITRIVELMGGAFLPPESIIKRKRHLTQVLTPSSAGPYPILRGSITPGGREIKCCVFEHIDRVRASVYVGREFRSGCSGGITTIKIQSSLQAFR